MELEESQARKLWENLRVGREGSLTRVHCIHA